MNSLQLAARREELVHRCAEQRVNLALELHALKHPTEAGHPLAASAVALLGARLLAHRRLAMSVLAAALGLALTRPARVVRLVRFAGSGLRMARQGMALVARFRQ